VIEKKDRFLYRTLFYNNYIDNTFNDEELKFVIQLCKNNYQYVLDNFDRMSRHNQLFLIATAFCDLKMIKLYRKNNKLYDLVYCNSHNFTGSLFNRVFCDGNCLIFACKTNIRLDVIKYFVEECDIDVKSTDYENHNCLYYACVLNSNPKIKEYLINEQKMTLMSEGALFGYESVNNAFWHNTNVEQIKYFVEVLKLDFSKQFCFSIACQFNPSINVIKYMVEKMQVKIDSSHLIDSWCSYGFHREIIQYLLEKCTYRDLELSMTGPYYKISFKRFFKIVFRFSENYTMLHNLLSLKLEYYQDEKEAILKMIERFNPAVLDIMITDKLGIMNCFDEKYDFNIFISHINNLTLPLERPMQHPIKYIETKKRKLDKITDYTKFELLFVHNDIKYFGDKEKIYSIIDVLNNLSTFDSSEPIILEGKQSSYIINLYLDSCLTQSIDLDKIKAHDFSEFLKFIDQYPSRYISIKNLEMQIIRYIDSHNLEITQLIKSLCHRYKMKYLYLYIHNKQIS